MKLINKYKLILQHLRIRQILFFLVIITLTASGIFWYWWKNFTFGTLIKLEYLSCSTNEDCVMVLDHCTCGCGTAINKKYEEEYNETFDKYCADFHGPVCDLNCKPTTPICLYGQCTLVEDKDLGEFDINL